MACGTAVIGDTTERALWIWNLPRQRSLATPSWTSHVEL